MNIPIYRAKKIDSDEYVSGWLIELQGKLYITVEWTTHKGYVEIDEKTLAIHFPDMLDSQGNKIFASLSASGKGGDIVSIYTSISKCDAIFYFDIETKSIKLLEKSKEKFSWEYGIVVDYENNPNKQIIGIEL